MFLNSSICYYVIIYVKISHGYIKGIYPINGVVTIVGKLLHIFFFVKKILYTILLLKISRKKICIFIVGTI